MQKYESFYEAHVTELRSEDGHTPTVWIACPQRALPAPGRYLLAWSTSDMESASGWPLFAFRTEGDGFLAAPPVPTTWAVGDRLTLRGPLGNGFDLPATARRVVLAALDTNASRLFPLVDRALAQGAALSIFADAILSKLPAAVEAAPLSACADALTWADYVAVDVPISRLAALRKVFALGPAERFTACRAQALVYTAMPCGGLADCGVCSLPTGKRWKLACKDGPVFELNQILD